MYQLLEELEAIEGPLGGSIASQIIPGIRQIIYMGLGYLSLDRGMKTLSGGEEQRVKIASIWQAA